MFGMPRILPALCSLILAVSAANADETASPDGQLGYLDRGGLMVGESAGWKMTLETLARLEFDYVATTGPQPSPEVAARLEKLELAVRIVEMPGQSDEDSVSGDFLRVLAEREGPGPGGPDDPGPART